MNKKHVLRRYPKLKRFVNGFYPYNPTIDWGDVKMYAEMMASDTEWLARSISGKQPVSWRQSSPEYVAMAISSRAHFAVLRNRLIRQLKAFEKKWGKK